MKINTLQLLALFLCLVAVFSLKKSKLKSHLRNQQSPSSNSTNICSGYSSSSNVNQDIFLISIEPYQNSLIDENGWQMYIFASDTPNNGSQCYGDCALAWPPVLLFPGATFCPDVGVNMSLISMINRTDNTTQLAYNGYPMYYFSLDESPGDQNGNQLVGAGNYWFLMNSMGVPLVPSWLSAGMANSTSGSMSIGNFPISAFNMSNNYVVDGNVSKTIQVMMDPYYGDYLVDENNRTLYVFSADLNGNISNCVDLCAEVYPPAIANGMPTVQGNLTSSMFSTMQRADNLNQLMVNGLPLYFYKLDLFPGYEEGFDYNLFGGFWYMVNGNGMPIENTNIFISFVL